MDLTQEIDALFAKLQDEIKQNPNSVLPKYTLEKSIALFDKSRTYSVEQNIQQDDSRIEAICRLLLDNIMTHYSIDELSSIFFLSRSRLSHLFTQTMGVSLGYWIEGQRVNAAKKLMKTTEMTVLDISTLLGYNDPLYFSRVFKKHSGLSPTKFKQLIK